MHVSCCCHVEVDARSGDLMLGVLSGVTRSSWWCFWRYILGVANTFRAIEHWHRQVGSQCPYDGQGSVTCSRRAAFSNTHQRSSWNHLDWWFRLPFDYRWPLFTSRSATCSRGHCKTFHLLQGGGLSTPVLMHWTSSSHTYDLA